MKDKVNIYNFSTANVISYISQNIDMTNEVVKIIKSKTPKVDKKTVDRVVIVNDLMSKVGDLINTVGEKFNIDAKKINKIITSINNITHIITLILKDITPKIISLAIFASFTIPSLIISRLYINVLAWFVRATFRSFGTIANFKIVMIKNAFSNFIEIVNDLIYVSKKLSILGSVSRIIIPLLFTARMYIYHLGKFMRTLYWVFSMKKTVKIGILKIYFNTLDMVSDLILSVTGKLIKLGVITLLTRWILKSATKYIIQLYIFNSLILTLFRKRDIIGMFIMKKYFEVLSNVIDSLILVSSKMRVLGFISRWINQAIKRSIKYIIKLSILVKLITTLFSVKDAVKLKITEIGIKSLYNIIDTLSSISLSIIKLGIVSLLAKPFFKSIQLYLLMLRKLVKSVTKVFDRIGLIAMIKTDVKSRILRSIFKHLIALAIESVLLAAASIIATPALLLDIVFVLTLTLFIKVLQIMLGIAKIKLKDIFTLIVLGLFISILVVVSYMVLKLSEIGSKINWLGLLASIGAILLVSLIAIAVGFAASTIFPILGISILGMLGVIILVGLLTLTAVLLKELQKFVLDKKALNDNITIIFDTVKNIISNIFKPNDTKEEKSDKTWFGSLMDHVGGRFSALKSISEAILTIPFLLSALISIGCLFLIANLLSKISEIQISEDINTKINEIIGTAKSISEIITRPVKQATGENGEETKWDRFKNFVGNTGIGRMIGSAVEIMKNIGSTGVLASILPNIMMLSTVVDLIKSINELTIPSDVNNKVTSIIEAAKLVSDQVGESSNIQSIDKDKVKVFGKYVDDSVKYFKHINKLDVSKIKSLNEMYDKMGQFMDKLQDAPISEIADALVNKISPALSDINNNLDKQSNPTQQTTQQPVAQQVTQTTQQPVAQQVTQNTQQIQQVDYTSILENIEDLLSNIKQKLNNNPQMVF